MLFLLLVLSFKIFLLNHHLQINRIRFYGPMNFIQLNHNYQFRVTAHLHKLLRKILDPKGKKTFDQFVEHFSSPCVDWCLFLLDSYQRRTISPLSRSYHHDNEILSTTLKSHLVRASESSDEMTNLSSPSMKCLLDDSSSISSPYIRRTPFVRRSLPHQNPSILKKTNFSKSASSPDPFKKAKTSTTRHLVFVDPTISSVMMPSKTTKMERHFSDLSLNQIENDCLITPLTLTRTRAPVSCSSASSSTTTCSSASSADDCSTPFIHIQRTNYLTERKATHYASSSIPTNSKTVPSKSTSFIHNVSITV